MPARRSSARKTSATPRKKPPEAPETPPEKRARGVIARCDSWAAFEAALAGLGKTEKGRAFEELTRLYLLTEPTYMTNIEEVWHHTGIPPGVFRALDLQRPEIGVDLVARDRRGGFVAIQCKFHQDPAQNVAYRELSAFFGMTERPGTREKLSGRIVSTSANGVSPRVRKVHREKLGFLTAAAFAKLGPDHFKAFRRYIKDTRPPRPKPNRPRAHQKKAVDACRDWFGAAAKAGGRAARARGKLIHPCGSGKSLTGFWMAERLGAKTVLVAVPSLALVRQTLDSWTREAVANGIDMEWMAVCSGADVARGADEAVTHVADLGVRVDTDPAAIARFLTRRRKRPAVRVIVATYQSGAAVSAGAARAGAVLDLGIYDEAHKTVGRKDKSFARLLDDANIRVKKRIFMTATERRFRGESNEIISMDDEAVYGRTFDELSFKQALEQQPPILSDYKVVTSIVTLASIRALIEANRLVRPDGADWSLEAGAETDASALAALIVLRKLARERGVRHAVSFHRSIRRATDFEALNTQANAAQSKALGRMDAFHVSGKMSAGARDGVLRQFVAAGPALVTNARCLTEGVDVPAIDAVLFADPKQSTIDIVQAAGRALRRSEGKDFGYIIVPVVLDDGAEDAEDAEDAADRAFAQIITVISALGAHDGRIVEEFRQIAAGERPAGGGEGIVHIDIPEAVRVKFADFRDVVNLRIWDRLGFGWRKGYEHLKAYVAEYGDARVHAAYKTGDGFKLGSWVGHRRTDYKNAKLDEDRIRRLEALHGWTWDATKP